ncbi:MAG: NAD(P)H-hydrate dehydratase [Lachnospiraceae bacterium]|nr:NAD(P)H-hydrate dehydratase [Lachnospiraceae bacterium]
MKERKMIRLSYSIRECLPERNPSGHKGTFGKAFIYSGSCGSAGCAILAGRAAYRTGAGMVKISSPECNRVIIQTALPEALYDTGLFAGRMHILDKWSDVYLAGPGIGTGSEAVAQLDALINGSGSKPLVLDADALTIISSDAGRYLSDDLRRMSAEGREIILTPHEGELHRLLKIVPDAPSDGDRLSLGMAVSEYFGCTVVAKGDVTYTITPGEDIVCNDDCGNSGMATAGSGDVLAGIITGLLAQGLEAHTAASYGVRIHALAGDAAAMVHGEHGLMAGDIPEYIF